MHTQRKVRWTDKAIQNKAVQSPSIVCNHNINPSESCLFRLDMCTAVQHYVLPEALLYKMPTELTHRGQSSSVLRIQVVDDLQCHILWNLVQHDQVCSVNGFNCNNILRSRRRCLHQAHCIQSQCVEASRKSRTHWLTLWRSSLDRREATLMIVGIWKSIWINMAGILGLRSWWRKNLTI